MSCCEIKLIKVPACINTLVIPVGLPNGEYETILTDKFNNKYYLNFEVDINGDMTIDTTLYPAGLLSKYSGRFTFEIFDGCDKKTIVQCDTEYSSLAFEFIGYITELSTYTVCCQE